MYYVLLCRHGPHQDGELLRDEKSNRYPTQFIGEVLRAWLWNPSPHGDDPIELRQVLYAPAREVRSTTAVLGDSLGRIVHGEGHDCIRLLPPRAADGKGNDPSQHRDVPVCECAPLAESEFMKQGMTTRWSTGF